MIKSAVRRLAAVDIMQVVRYYLVGAIVNAGGYLLFLWLIHEAVEAKAAASILYVAGALVSFWLNRKLVFDSGLDVRSSLIRLVIMLLAGYVINMAMLYVFVDKLHVGAWLVQAISVVVVSIFFYIVNKFYVHESVEK